MCLSHLGLAVRIKRLWARKCLTLPSELCLFTAQCTNESPLLEGFDGIVETDTQCGGSVLHHQQSCLPNGYISNSMATYELDLRQAKWWSWFCLATSCSCIRVEQRHILLELLPASVVAPTPVWHKNIFHVVGFPGMFPSFQMIPVPLKVHRFQADEPQCKQQVSLESHTLSVDLASRLVPPYWEWHG